MIRVSNQKLKLNYFPGYPEPRYTKPYFEVPTWGYIDVSKYMTCRSIENGYMPLEVYYNLWSNCEIYQFDVLRPDLKTLQRQYVSYNSGTSNLIVWSWVNCYIKYPIYKIIAAILNKFIHFKEKLK